MGTISSQKIRRNIMMRVWYSYGISVVASPMFLQGMAFSLSLYIFKEAVHVSSTINNIMSVKVGVLPEYVFNIFVQAAQNGEVMTLLTFTLLFTITMSVLSRARFLFLSPKFA